MGQNYVEKIPKLFRWCVNFIFLNVMWMLFRAESVSQAIGLFRQLFVGDFWKLSDEMVSSTAQLEYNILYKVIGFFGGTQGVVTVAYITILLGSGLWICLVMENVQKKLPDYRMTWVQTGALAGLLLYTVLSLTSQSTFLYFNF
jgi:alginate O-acetyltransferase complex protein AlgI